MPLCTLHLIKTTSSLPSILKTLTTSNPKPLLISRVIRWIIKPTTLTLDPLLSHTWDLLIIYPSIASLPSSLSSQISQTFSLTAGIPSSLLSTFDERNRELIHPKRNEVVPLTGSLEKPRVAGDAQNLEFTEELGGWIKEWDPKGERGAVSMLNLLAFRPDMHASYLQYGKAFAETIGKRRGGVAKVVGRVVPGDGDKESKTKVEKGKEQGNEGWEEMALAHYPSIWHFADMAASEDYQEVNHKFRVPSLRDTCILMTSEVEVERIVAGDGGKRGAKL